MSARVVALGDLMVDIVATASAPLVPGSDAPATVRTHGGGSAANVAAWLAATGGSALLVARVGDDAAGRAAVAELAAGGVDVRAAVDLALPTGTCVVVVEPGGERTFLPDRGANEALATSDLPADAFRPGDHLPVSGYALLDAGPARDTARAALARAGAAGMTVSVDPASSAPLRRVGAETFLAWTRGADLLLPNADEARTLTGETEPERAALALARRAGAEVVVTLGASGALWSDGSALHREAGEAVCGDSTGAGDAWTAGWLAARPSLACSAHALLPARRPRRGLGGRQGP